MSNQIFISYRRNGGDIAAKLICEALRNRGYSVFFDYDTLKSGFFDSKILESIEQCDDFVLVLPKNALDRCKDEQDWVRQEIRHALLKKKNIIPVRLGNFEFPKKLPQDIQDVLRYTAIRFQMEFFDTVINMITERLISTPRAEKEIPKKTAAPTPKEIRLTVYSPVNTEVFLNDTEHPIMRIDCNTGFDYASNTVTVCGKFDLIFRAKGFLKRLTYDSATVITNFDVNLSKILHSIEIEGSYSRDEAWAQIRRKPTAYAYQQLKAVGKAEDIDLLLDEMKKYMMIMAPDQHENYLIANCFVALGELAFRYKQPEKARVLLDVYQFYGAKRSYGWMMEPIVKKLRAYGL
ncbi:MAG: toll/interleukin-1 receptor domain-containing protein [Clostridia bacterium]|nr:toll/interleukin-1 receptor domain-containing protein [Clostridia bacterium]